MTVSVSSVGSVCLSSSINPHLSQAGVCGTREGFIFRRPRKSSWVISVLFDSSTSFLQSHAQGDFSAGKKNALKPTFQLTYTENFPWGLWQALMGRNILRGERTRKLGCCAVLKPSCSVCQTLNMVSEVSWLLQVSKSETLSISNPLQQKAHLKTKWARKQKIPHQSRLFEQHIILLSLSRWHWCVRWVDVL